MTHHHPPILNLTSHIERLDQAITSFRLDRADNADIDPTPGEAVAGLACDLEKAFTADELALLLAVALYRLAYPLGEPGFPIAQVM